MVNPSMIASGVASTMLTNRVEKSLENDDTKKVEDFLIDLHIVLLEISEYLKASAQLTDDIFRFVTLFKAGFGPPYIPHYENRAHIAFLAGPTVTLDVTSSGLGAFTSILTGGLWRTLDYPDGTSYLLDTTAPSNAMVLWERQTNQVNNVT